MAKQSQSGGGGWAPYISHMAFRYGWQSAATGQPFDDDAAFTMAQLRDPTGAVQRLYEAGRLMALETRMPLPARAKRMTNEMRAVVKAAPEFCKQLRTEHVLASIEAKRAAAARLREWRAAR